ncbi:MAG: hypothetical protein U0136_06720 [Bdellovibrionota bacterium]
MTNQLLLSLHAFASFFMCGLIWVIQVVHYPTFVFVERDRYAEFQRLHEMRISLIVIPVMLLELVSGALIALRQESSLWTINLVLILLVWGSTFAIQSPIHGKLEKGFDERLVKRLLRSNWVRTVLWTIHSLIVFLLLNDAFS